jgi:molybdopterin-containing oxidoreductase family iron-sulfur binding subunit
VSRREFLFLTAGITAAGYLAGCSEEAREAFFQTHFLELDVAELEERLSRLEARYSERYHQQVQVDATPARPATRFGYGLDISVCVGCRRCVYACVRENNQSRNPQIHWIRVLEMDKDQGIDLQHADQHYDHDTVPAEGKFYMPVQCQQCENPPCVQTCPVGATWQEPDGIVVIDYDWCIGCRCCIAACPYGARHFNWGEAELPDEVVNPDMHYLGNRPRPRGVVEKCTFCIQRVRKGRYPACVEICPVGARKFGNLLDEESEIRYVLRNKRVFILKRELNTHPKFFYFYTR